MNATRLLSTYEQISEAPDAIVRMRRFVLDLAVRGKLVDQHSSDGLGATLKKKILASWKDRLHSGEIKKIKKWPEISKTDLLFDIPQTWGLVRLGEAIELINGRAFKPTDWTPQGLPIVRIQNLNNPKAPFNHFNGEVKSKFLIDTGDFLISWSGTPGTSFGAHIWERGKAVLNQHIFKTVLLGEAFEKQFLKIAINSRLLELIEQAHGGVGLQHITKPKLEAVVLTLPPLAEQHRIVEKTNELMALCDQLERARAMRESTRDKLTIASFARLTGPETTEENFPVYARFVVNALPALTAHFDQIKHLRQTILNLAVRGKLVEQDSTDEPASELLKRIEVEKVRLGKEVKVRKTRADSVIELDNSPFSVPTGWIWTQIAQLGLINPRNEAPNDYEASFVPMSMIYAEYGIANRHESRPWGSINKGYTHFAEGDVGLAKITPCFENGKSAVFRNLTGRMGSGTTELYILRPLIIVADYILLFLKSRHFIESGISRMTGTAGQKRVPAEYFTSSPFPLPPLAEQHRIVEKVNELMALCDQLEEVVGSVASARMRLLDVILHEALDVSLEWQNSRCVVNQESILS